ncbi:MAG TPA: PKD domain-containing protein [Thermoanaerobaculia bacterium]|nr:PKD domain-containing protein [Thermoanaerobaculia bacterium]
MRCSKSGVVFLAVASFSVAIADAGADSCGEATCVPAEAAYISHFTGPDCTGTESYYLPYNGYAYDCRTWDGNGVCGTVEHTVTNRSYRLNGNDCSENAWSPGNTLEHFVTVYRSPCGEATCVPAEAAYISHFTGPDCTGTESYYLPYNGYAYDCRTWDGNGECGTVEHTVTNRSYRLNGNDCSENAWSPGNTLEHFVTVYRAGTPPPPPQTYPPVACGYASYGGSSAPLDVWFYGSCSYDPDGGSITAYQWDFWEGIQWGSFGFHTYFYPGAYPVYLTVWDDEGEWSSSFIETIWVY